MALEGRQPIGDLCDLLGIPRFNPGVFDAMVDLLCEGGQQSEETEREARIAAIAARARR